MHSYVLYVALYLASTHDSGSQSTNDGKPLLIGVSVAAMVVIVALLFGVLYTVTTRKRAHGITWFPENFFGAGSKAGTRSSGSRRVPDGEEMR